MDVLLVRHAKSSHQSSYRSDAERPLSAIGWERQKQASEGMKTLGFTIDEVWVSPYTRAKQTLTIILSILQQKPRIIEKPGLIVYEDPHAIYDELTREAKHSPQKTLLLVGHNPNLSDLLSLLCPDTRIIMKTSDLAHVRFLLKENQLISKLIAYYSRKELTRLR